MAAVPHYRRALRGGVGRSKSASASSGHGSFELMRGTLPALELYGSQSKHLAVSRGMRANLLELAPAFWQ